MKKLIALVLALTMMFVLVSCGTSGSSSSPAPADSTSAPAEQEVYTLKLAAYTKDLVQINFEGDFAERVSEATDGRVAIEYVDIGSVGGDTNALGMLRDGMVDLYKDCAAFTSTEFPLMCFADIPMLFTNDVTASSVFYSLYQDGWFDKELEGLVLCEIDCSGMQKIFTVNPVSSLADLQGIKIRVATGVAGAFVQSMGAVPMTIGRADTYMSLQTGVVDGMINIPLSCWENTQYEVTNYIVDVNIFGGLQFILMNEDSFAALPADIQLQLRDLFDDLQDGIKYYLAEAGSEKVNAMVNEKSMGLVSFSAADKAAMKAAAQTVRESYIQQMNELGYDAKAFFEAVDYYASIYDAGK
jgi:TRAP-type C4-dicarboxylate transport system substrate-binding protein